MQTLELSYYQRIILWTNIGAHQVRELKEAHVFLRLIDKFRLTDEEMLRSQFIQDQGRMTWRLPEQGYGDRCFDLEQDEAKALVNAIEAPSQGLRVTDAEWMVKVVEVLNAGQPQMAQPVN
jgi:nucleoid-associated protein YgaU